MLESDTEESEFEGPVENNDDIRAQSTDNIRTDSATASNDDNNLRTESATTDKSVYSEGGTTKRVGKKDKGIVLQGAMITAYATSIF